MLIIGLLVSMFLFCLMKYSAHIFLVFFEADVSKMHWIDNSCLFTAITRICFKFAAMNCQHLQVRLSVVWNPLANLFQSWVSILKWILVACSLGRDQPCPYDTSAEYNELQPVQYILHWLSSLFNRQGVLLRTLNDERWTPNAEWL